MKVTPVLLIILDGFGCSESQDNNAIASAHKPNWDKLWQTCPHTTINASEASVGLPGGQMGNSEVGHLNIGAGRVVYQEFTRINRAISSGNFFANPALTQAVETARSSGKALHILGLLSDGGVHSHETHIHAMLELAARAGVKKIYLHAFLDGRDTPPRSAQDYLRRLQEKCDQLKVGRIASIIGRYFVMDRDKRWLRVKAGYDLLTQGKAEFQAESAEAALAAAYARDENDEFVKATAIVPPGAQPVRMEDGDVVVFMNFRSDRAREITRAFIEPGFDLFEREHVPQLAAYCTLTEYSKDFNVPVAYPPEQIRNGFGEYISNLGLKQLQDRGNREICPRHLLLRWRRGTRLPGRGPHPGSLSGRSHLRSEAGNERIRGHRQAGRSHRKPQVRRHHLQLRQRRHGWPYRHDARSGQGDRNAGPVLAAGWSRQCSRAAEKC